MKYRKKPVVIEAVAWDETHTTLNKLIAQGLRYSGYSGHVDRPDECTSLRIKTLEGSHDVTPGDYIIRGVKGEFYPCKPDIFALTYEPAATPPLAPCEPSAEPSLEEVERVFVEASGLTIGHRGEVQDGWGYAREGLAAVRALCLRAREAPLTLRDIERAYEYGYSHFVFGEYGGQHTSGLRSILALFVKEKLT